MIRKRLSSKMSLSLMIGVPIAALSIAQFALAAPYVGLKDSTDTPVKDGLSATDRITMANGAVYAAGPAYSPKETCNDCHDYKKITKAYHFMQGALPGGEGMGVSDTWSSENQDGTAQKYLANAYGHLLSGGQYGAW